MKRIQFLVCPQKDFIGRLGSEVEGAPSTLHVGASGVTKLRGDGQGPDPFETTTRRIFEETCVDGGRIDIVLDEDWHNVDCPEFAVYGRHCVKGTDGARLVGDLESYRWADRTHVLRANSVNIASHPKYRETLEDILDGTRPSEARVGAYGVWTHIKVEYLVMNLMTMTPAFPTGSVGVCAPLCASPADDDHARGMEKIRALGAQVFDSILVYLDWMGLPAATA